MSAHAYLDVYLISVRRIYFQWCSSDRSNPSLKHTASASSESNCNKRILYCLSSQLDHTQTAFVIVVVIINIQLIIDESLSQVFPNQINDRNAAICVLVRINQLVEHRGETDHLTFINIYIYIYIYICLFYFLKFFLLISPIHLYKLNLRMIHFHNCDIKAWYTYLNITMILKTLPSK